MLADEDRRDISLLAKFAEEDELNPGTFLTRLWAAFGDLEAEHEECLKRQASLGLYLQHLRASAKAASRGYLVGDEARILNAIVADLERAMIGHWPISHDEVENLVKEAKERDLPG